MSSKYSSKEPEHPTTTTHTPQSFPAGSISNPDDGVLACLEDFFYFEDPLTERVEDWANNQDKELLDTFANEEHSLAHTALHNDYKELFETILTEFLQQQGFTVEQFYHAAAEEEEEMAGKRRQGDTFSAVVMAASDFDQFCEMMNDVRQGRGVAFCPPLMTVSEGEEEDAEFAKSEFAREEYNDVISFRTDGDGDEGKGDDTFAYPSWLDEEDGEEVRESGRERNSDGNNDGMHGYNDDDGFVVPDDVDEGKTSKK